MASAKNQCQFDLQYMTHITDFASNTPKVSARICRKFYKFTILKILEKTLILVLNNSYCLHLKEPEILSKKKITWNFLVFKMFSLSIIISENSFLFYLITIYSIISSCQYLQNQQFRILIQQQQNHFSKIKWILSSCSSIQYVKFIIWSWSWQKNIIIFMLLSVETQQITSYLIKCSAWLKTTFQVQIQCSRLCLPISISQISFPWWNILMAFIRTIKLKTSSMRNSINRLGTTII